MESDFLFVNKLGHFATPSKSDYSRKRPVYQHKKYLEGLVTAYRYMRHGSRDEREKDKNSENSLSQENFLHITQTNGHEEDTCSERSENEFPSKKTKMSKEEWLAQLKTLDLPIAVPASLQNQTEFTATVGTKVSSKHYYSSMRSWDRSNNAAGPSLGETYEYIASEYPEMFKGDHGMFPTKEIHCGRLYAGSSSHRNKT